MLFYYNPMKVIKPSINIVDTHYNQDFATVFFLTLSNSAIVLLYISLFARFQYNPYDKKWLTFAVGLLSIGVGVLAWWLFITTCV